MSSSGPSPSFDHLSSVPFSEGYRVTQIPGKGKGLVARKDVIGGTTLVSEEPSLMLDASSGHVDLSHLSLDTRTKLLLLPPLTSDSDPIMARLPGFTRFGREGILAYLPRISLVNHACSPNAIVVWERKEDGGLLAHLLAIAPIFAGTEILISYLPSPRTRKERHSYLQSIFHFDCDCSSCILPPSEQAIQDSKVSRFVEFTKSIASNSPRSSLPLTLRVIAGLADDAVENALLISELRDVLRMAAEFSVAGADKETARAWGALWRQWTWFLKDFESFHLAGTLTDPSSSCSWGKGVGLGLEELLEPPHALVWDYVSNLQLAPGYVASLPPPPPPRTSLLGALSTHFEELTTSPSFSSSSKTPEPPITPEPSPSSPPSVPSNEPSLSLSISTPSPSPMSNPESSPIQEADYRVSTSSSDKTGLSKGQKRRLRRKESEQSSTSLGQLSSSSPSLDPPSPGPMADPATSSSAPTSPVLKQSSLPPVVPTSLGLEPDPTAAAFEVKSPKETETMELGSREGTMFEEEEDSKITFDRSTHYLLDLVLPSPLASSSSDRSSSNSLHSSPPQQQSTTSASISGYAFVPSVFKPRFDDYDNMQLQY
ncbi:hypothetical protein BDY24DRAFT_411133 [Mrakia frigida]|uniref:SET domain-containing protein n=1 Tax=Mrakia frigida TaxID=29902 RepID=UPI003FCBFAE0